MTKVRKSHKKLMFEGLPLVDAAQDVAIVITKKDATESKKKDPASCAAALAGRREFKTDVRVYMTRMYVKDKQKKRWIRFMTPLSVQKEITSFDRGASFEPGEYTFKAPPPSSRLGYARGQGSQTHGDRKQKAKHMTANVRLSAKEGYSRK